MKASKKSPFAILHETSTIDGNRAKHSRIFKYSDRIFKMQYRLENGVSDVSLQIMKPEGDFVTVLTNFDLGHVFSTSYVGYPPQKEKDIISAVALVEKIIPKVWAI